MHPRGSQGIAGAENGHPSLHRWIPDPCCFYQRLGCFFRMFFDAVPPTPEWVRTPRFLSTWYLSRLRTCISRWVQHQWVHNSCLFSGGFDTPKKIFGVLVSPLTGCPPHPKQVFTPRFQTTQDFIRLRMCNTHCTDWGPNSHYLLGGLRGVWITAPTYLQRGLGGVGSPLPLCSPHQVCTPRFLSTCYLSELRTRRTSLHSQIHNFHFSLAGFGGDFSGCWCLL